MSRIDSGFRRLVAYTVGGVGLLAFVLFLRALFMTQSGSDGDISSAAGDLLGATFFSEEGDEMQPAWSPDGRYLAYVSRRDGRSYLFRRDLQTNEVIQIATDAWSAIWSPDGAHLAYGRPTGNENDLYVTDVDGSRHVKVNDAPNPAGVHWLPDSQSILFSVRRGEGEVHIVSADGSSARTLYIRGVWAFSLSDLSPDGKLAIGSGMGRESQLPTGLIGIDLQTGEFSALPIDDPAASYGQWSSDGQYVVYSTPDPNPSLGSIVRVTRLAGGESHTFPGINVVQYAWSPDSRFIAYTSAIGPSNGELTIAWADSSRYVPLHGLTVDSFTWSPDGSQMALSVRNGDQFDIVIIRADEASLLAYLAALETTPTPLPPPFPTSTLFPTPTPLQNYDFYRPTRLTNDPSGNWRPAVSPDGRSIAFASERDGNWDISLLDLATGAEMRLTDDPLSDMAPSWSPDGTRIAYQHNIPDLNGPVLVDRIVMNADGSGKTVVASGSVWNGNEPPAWSPSSDRIAFTDSRSIVVVSITDQREVTRFTPPDVRAYREPVWIDDGHIAFADDGVLTIGDVTTSAVTPVAGAPGFARLPMWSNAFSRLGYFALEGGSARLMSVYPNSNDPYTLAEFSAGLVQHAAWSPDGRFIAYYADTSIHVAITWSEQYRDNAPLFVIPTSGGLTDLNSLSWLPDSSGFVFVDAIDGQPDLYLAMLNGTAIQAYLDYYPLYAPTQILLSTPFPPPIGTTPTPPRPPTPWATPTPWLGFDWTPTPAAIPTGTPPYWLLLFSPRYGGWVDVAGQHIWITGLYGSSVYSSDGGGTWSEFGPFGASVTSIEPSAHFEIDRTVYILAGGVIYRSSDGGTSWKPVASNNGAGYTGISVADDSTIFATSGGRGHCEVHRSLDGGLTWIVQLSDDNCLMTRVIASLEYANDGIVYTLTDNRGLWRSRDRGDTWEQITTNNPADLATDSSNPSTVYMVSTDGDLLRSDNYGDEWLGPLLPAFATAAGIAPNGTVIVGTKDGRVYESTDRGVTWSEISTFSGDPIRDIATTDGVIYVLTERDLLGGYDEGAPLPATPTPLPTP